MKAAEQPHNVVQILRPDSITGRLLIGGTLERYIRELSVAGLTPNPSACDHAIRGAAPAHSRRDTGCTTTARGRRGVRQALKRFDDMTRMEGAGCACQSRSLDND